MINFLEEFWCGSPGKNVSGYSKYKAFFLLYFQSFFMFFRGEMSYRRKPSKKTYVFLDGVFGGRAALAIIIMYPKSVSVKNMKNNAR